VRSASSPFPSRSAPGRNARRSSTPRSSDRFSVGSSWFLRLAALLAGGFMVAIVEVFHFQPVEWRGCTGEGVLLL